jgi:WD40 repeat protein
LVDRRPVVLDDKETEPASRPAVWPGNVAPVLCVAFSTDGRLALSSSGHIAYKPGLKPERLHNTVRVWDAWKGQEKKHLQGFDDGLSSVAFSPLGKYAVFSISGRWTGPGKYAPSKDHSIRLWDLEAEREVPSFKNRGTGGGRPRGPGGLEAEPRFKGHEDEVWSVAYSPDGRHIASGSRAGDVRIWDVDSGDMLCRYDSRSKGVHSIAYSPKGDRVVCGSYDFQVRVLDARTGREVRTLSDHTDIVFGVAFSPDGRSVASGGGSRAVPGGFVPGTRDHVVRVWDVESGKIVARLAGHGEPVHTVAFSPDGRRVVSGGEDQTVRVWDVGTARELRRFTQHKGIVRSVAVSPDGRFALSGADDYAIRLWELPPTVRDLLAAIAKKDGAALARIAGDLDALGDEVQTAVPHLLGLLKTAPADLAAPALDVLRRGRPAAAQARDLAALLAVSTPGVRPYARDALVQLGGAAKEALPDVLQILRRHSDAATWLGALAVLDKMGDASPETRETLGGPGLAHAEAKVREEALNVLLRLAPDALEIDALVKLLQKERSPKIREIAERGLEKRLSELTRETLAPVRGLLRLPDASRITLLALGVVQRLKGEAAELVPDVVPLLRSTDDAVRRGALRALEAVGRPAAAAVPELVKLFPTLRGRDPLRLQTALTMTTLAPEDARVIGLVLPVLLEALKPGGGADEARIVRSIGAMGEPAVDPVFEAVEKARGSGVDRANQRKALYRALAAIGKPAYSEANYDRLKQLARKELYKDVQEAAYRAAAAIK